MCHHARCSFIEAQGRTANTGAASNRVMRHPNENYRGGTEDTKKRSFLRPDSFFSLPSVSPW